jgi:hypothetical protein
MKTARFEAVRPKTLDIKELRLSALAGMNELSEDILREYQKTTKYWKKNRPVFTRRLETNVGGSGEKIAVTIYTDNSVYRYIDRGTSGTVIDARKKPIVMSGVYKAGSTPGTLIINSLGGVEGGSKRVLRGVFFHPGIRARLFTEQIQKKMESSSEFRMTERLQSSVERARDKWLV